MPFCAAYPNEGCENRVNVTFVVANVEVQCHPGESRRILCFVEADGEVRCLTNAFHVSSPEDNVQSVEDIGV
jgi:hypothetical protein